jgi:hypothetical protein
MQPLSLCLRESKASPETSLIRTDRDAAAETEGQWASGHKCVAGEQHPHLHLHPHLTAEASHESQTCARINPPPARAV